MQSEMGTILDDQAQKIHELVNKAQQIAAIETLGLSEETQRIQELEAQLQRPLAVAVIGEFSTGKSSFINAVLGRDLLPAKYVPTTQQTMRIHHIDDKGMVSIRDQKEHSSLPLSKEAIVELAATGEPLEIEMLIPSPWSDLVIYDTPGVNDATAMAEEVVFELMDSVDVVIFMMRADGALKKSEATFLKRLVHKKDLDKFFFNVNFADLLTSTNTTSVKVHVADTLAQLRNWPMKEIRERVFLCSAKAQLGGTESVINEHAGLLSAIHHYASTRKQELLQTYASNMLLSVTDSVVEKLTIAIDVAADKDQSYGLALKALNEEINTFRLLIREDELQFQSQIREQKRLLMADVGNTIQSVQKQFHDHVKDASEQELHQQDWLKKSLRIEVEEQLGKLFADFLSQLEGSITDLEGRILPGVSRTLGKLKGMQISGDYSGIVAGAGVATAGYLAVSTALPWAAGAAGVTLLASFIPGVNIAVGALLSAGVSTGIPMLSNITKTLYNWLKINTQDWQLKRNKKQILAELDTILAKIRQEVIAQINASIDPVELGNKMVMAQIPHPDVLENRRIQATKLDRNQVRKEQQELEALHTQFVQLKMSIRSDS